MVYTIAKGKFPKKPEFGKVLEVCRKDFRKFKEDNGNKVIENFDFRIKSTAQIGTTNNILINQKENLESVRKLIQESKEDIAFSIFFRTFPSCLPHRSRSL
ncbi:MAG: hypothetical protein KAT57_02945 [Candidatus Lokiarchaeota archaeon]|nr:hypothetical protein [Candidatus Lokiarchaeota archaeon]